MEKCFELVIPSYSSSQGFKDTIEFENGYGNWSVNIVTGSQEIFGTIILAPRSFEESLINYKQVKIIVERKNWPNRQPMQTSRGCVRQVQPHANIATAGSGYSVVGVTAEHHGRSTFWFGPLPPVGNTSYCEFLIKVEMPQLAPRVSLLTRMPSQYSGVRDHLQELFVNGRYADVTVKAMDKEFNVHKCILARSKVFDEMFNSQLAQGILNMGDVKHEVLVEMFRFLYSDEIPKLEMYANELLALADKYAITDLASKCAQFLMENINSQNVLHLLATTERLNQSILRDTAIDFIVKNCKEIFLSEEWNRLKKSNMPLAMLVMEKYMLVNVSNN